MVTEDHGKKFQSKLHASFSGIVRQSVLGDLATVIQTKENAI